MIGIYMITNKINDKKYIGQGVNLERRVKEHKRNMHHNEYLTRAINKYGIENFEFTILEKCSIEMIDEKEIKWISFYDSTNENKGYNMCSGGNGRKKLTDAARRKISEGQKGRKLSEETKNKISEAHKGSKNHNYGKKASAETCQKRREAMTGRKITEEHRQKIKDSRKHALTDEQIKEICEIRPIYTLKQIAEKYNVSYGLIKQVTKGIYKY